MSTVMAANVDFDTLYAQHWHAMVRLAILLVDDRLTAEDVVQDAFVALHRKPPREQAAVAAYLRTSVLNGARSVLRRRRVARRHLHSVVDIGAPPGSPDDLLLAAAENADMISALRQLPRRQREVLVLRYWSQLSEAEIAQTLGVSAGTVKSTASRGLSALETILGGAR